MEQTYPPKIPNFIALDKFCDFIPFVSTVTNSINLINLIRLRVFNNIPGPGDTEKAKPFTQDHYFRHLNQKGFTSCILLAIPFLNIIFAFYNWLNTSLPATKTFDNDTKISKNIDGPPTSTLASDEPPSTQPTRKEKPLIAAGSFVAENCVKTNKELTLDFYENVEDKNLLNETLFSLKIDLETYFIAFNETAQRTWDEIQPYLKNLAFLSAIEVKTEDPLRWLLTLPQNKSNFLDLIDASEGLSPSYRQNFLRKLAQMHNHSEDFHLAFEERNLHTHDLYNMDVLLQPKVWPLLEPLLEDQIFPKFLFSKVLTSLSRIDHITSEFVISYQESLTACLEGLEEFTEAALNFPEKQSAIQKELTARYLQLLDGVIGKFEAEGSSYKNKKRFLNHLLTLDILPFGMLEKNRGSKIIKFIFDHANSQQIKTFFVSVFIALNGRGNLGKFLILFSFHLTQERKDKLFSILLEFGQCQNGSELLLMKMCAPEGW